MLSLLDCVASSRVSIAEVGIRLSQVAFAGGRVLLAVDGISDEHIILLSEASTKLLPMRIHAFAASLRDVA